MPVSSHGNHLGVTNYITLLYFPPPPPQLRNGGGGGKQWGEGVAERAGMVRKIYLSLLQGPRLECYETFIWKSEFY